MLDDWEGIAPPRDSAVLNVLRADPSHPLDFRIGRDARGRFVFQLDAGASPPETGSVERSWFRVGEGFPCIVRGDLRPGVSRVRYQVALADCMAFRIDEAEAFAS